MGNIRITLVTLVIFLVFSSCKETATNTNEPLLTINQLKGTWVSENESGIGFKFEDQQNALMFEGIYTDWGYKKKYILDKNSILLAFSNSRLKNKMYEVRMNIVSFNKDYMEVVKLEANKPPLTTKLFRKSSNTHYSTGISLISF